MINIGFTDLLWKYKRLGICISAVRIVEKGELQKGNFLLDIK
jgi:hypothetical protein